MSDDLTCPRCGGPTETVDAPIWERYCADKACNMAAMRDAIRAMNERRERAELARLKAKYEDKG